MFCSKCGMKLDDDARFCGNCGAAVEQAPTQPAETAPAEVEQAPTQPAETAPAEVEQPTEYAAPEQPAAYTQPTEYAAPEQPVEFVQPTGFEPAQVPFAAADFTPSKPKKSKKPLVGILCAAVAVVLAVSVAFNWGWLYGTFLRTFGSESDYFEYVEMQQFKAYTGTATEVYGSVLQGNASGDFFAEASTKYQVGDGATSLLKNLSGGDVDLSWLNEVEFKTNTALQDNLQSLGMALRISDQDILSLMTVIDSETGEIYLSLPGLTDQVILLENTMPRSTAQIYQILGAARSSLPSEKELNDLLLKYIEVALGSVDNVSKDSKVLRVNGIEEKCTVLKVKITPKTLCKMAEAVLKEAKNDKKLRSIIESMGDAAEKLDADVDGEEIYELFQDAVEDALEELDKIKDEAGNQELLVLKDYVNGKHEIIGRSVEVDGETVFHYATVTKGKKFATELEVGDGYIKVEGEGTQSGNKKNGTYQLSVGGTKYAELEVIDLDTKKLDDGYLNGTFRVSADGLLKSIDGGDLVTMFFNPVLELKVQDDGREASVECNLLNKDELIIGVVSTAKQTDSGSIKKPDGNLVDLQDSDDIEAFIESLDLDGLISKLRSVGIPREFVDQLEDGIEELEDRLSNQGRYEYNYWDDDYDYWDDDYDYDYWDDDYDYDYWDDDYDYWDYDYDWDDDYESTGGIGRVIQ